LAPAGTIGRVPTVAAILAALNSAAPSDKGAGWDPEGLQLGDAGATVSRVAVCHEVTERVVDQAVAAQVDLLISYHPLLFDPVRAIVAGPGPGGRAYRLVRAGVALAAVHTSWDSAPGGSADALAAALGLGQNERFGPVEPQPQVKIVTFLPVDAVEAVRSALTAAGAGRIGRYEECSFITAGTGTFRAGEGADPVVGEGGGVLNDAAEVRLEMVAPKSRLAAVAAALVRSHPYEEAPFDVYDSVSNPGLIGRVGRVGDLDLASFGQAVEAALQAAVRIAGDRTRSIGRVAVVPGAGAGLISAAAAAGAGTLVTGDVSHHRAVEAADRGMAIIDPGHAATEGPGVAALREAVAGIVGTLVEVDDRPLPWWRP
jgi:dinuclear metal center YbgI/SA1388 family protein